MKRRGFLSGAFALMSTGSALGHSQVASATPRGAVLLGGEKIQTGYYRCMGRAFAVTVRELDGTYMSSSAPVAHDRCCGYVTITTMRDGKAYHSGLRSSEWEKGDQEGMERAQKHLAQMAIFSMQKEVEPTLQRLYDIRDDRVTVNPDALKMGPVNFPPVIGDAMAYKDFQVS